MIDAHHHFWQYNPAEFGWIDSTMSVLRRDFIPPDLVRQIQGTGVRGVISVQARQSLQETRWLLDLARQHSIIRGVVGWVPLTLPSVADYIEEFSSNPKLRAVRHVLQDEPDDRFMLGDEFNRGISTLKKFKLAYDILIFERHLPACIEFVDRHPEQVFILDHIAKPKIKAGEIEPWRKNIFELAKRHNVYCKISGMVTEADHKTWTPEKLRPYFDAVVEAFSPRRLMFGSDWPVCLLASDYPRWVQTVRDWAAGFSEAEKDRLFSDTAEEAYGLDKAGMKTIVLQNPGDLRLVETATPDDPPPGSALVRVHRVGICGTDWHAYRGKQPFFTYPRIIGHELGVVVEKINAPESSIKIGDRCAVEPYLNCGKCIACRRGKGNCCVNLQVMGVHVDGGMRQRVLIPARKLHPSAKLDFDQLALVETLAIGCHAVDRAQIQKDEWTLVIGAGPIGLSVIPFAMANGAKVIVMDISPSRLAFCREKMGVQHTIQVGPNDPMPALRDLTDGDLPTAVLDATGNSLSMMQAFNFVASGGRLVFVGLFQGDVTFNDPNFHRREMTLLATRNARPEDFTRIIRLVEDGVIDTKPWITHRVACDDLVEMIPKWLEPSVGVIKAIVEF